MAIWVTSDWHFNHKNILNYCRQEFSSIEEHNDLIVKNYNNLVGPDDLVYVLGDVGFVPAQELSKIIEQLKGRKVLIVGNHDILNVGQYRKMGFIDVVNHPVYYSSNIILSHFPLRECLDNPWAINVHGHLHNGELELPNFFNVNVELCQYYPVSMKKFEEIAKENCPQSRYQPFGQEWYAKWEKRRERTG